MIPVVVILEWVHLPQQVPGIVVGVGKLVVIFWPYPLDWLGPVKEQRELWLSNKRLGTIVELEAVAQGWPDALCLRQRQRE